MRKYLVLIMLAGLGGGGYYAAQNYDLRQVLHNAMPAASSAEPPASDELPQPPACGRETIRLASVNLGRFDEMKLASPRYREVLAQLIARFDLVAIQGLYGPNQGIVVRLLEQINLAQRSYDFAVSPTLGLHGPTMYSALVFDRQSLEIDRSVLYQIEDTTGRLHHNPLVGSFRTRGPNPAEAFTFTIVSVAVTADDPAEVEMLEHIYRAVRERRPGEDDVLLVGTTMCGPAEMARLEQVFGLGGLISNIPTTTRGTQLADNILFNRRATTEFTGRAGVVDLVREFNLSLPEALDFSEHLPVWGEFSVFEGGQAGQVTSVGMRNIR